jgi:gliding motility-associated-like protein
MKKIFFLLIMFTTFFGRSQEANDCVDAIIICGNTNISSNVSGYGLQELEGTTNLCTYREENSLWLNVSIATSGTLAFTLRPDDTDINVDYDFYIFGPNTGCGNFDNPIRCSTTNPFSAGLNDNLTGLRDSETDQNEGPDADGNSFVSSVNVIASEQYYILIERPEGNGGFSLEWTGTADFLPSPIVNKPDNIEVCAASNSVLVDISQDPAVLTPSTNVTIDYYTSYEDAFDFNVNAIPDPTQYSFSGNSTNIYIRVTNANGCFEITDFTLTPLEFDEIDPLNFKNCDTNGNGQAIFSPLNIINNIRINISDNVAFDVSLHRNEIGANTGTNQIIGDTYEAPASEIFVRISTTSQNSCFVTHPTQLYVVLDNLPKSVDLEQCDIDEGNSTDGFTRLNLNNIFSDITDFQVLFYETEFDRMNDNPIPNPENYINTVPFNQTIYRKLLTDSCEKLGIINIQITPDVIGLGAFGPILACDENQEDAVLEGFFDIEVFLQNNYPNLDATLYENLMDASLEINPLPMSFSTEETTIYIRLEEDNQCRGVEELQLIVNQSPEIMLESDYQFCTDGEPLPLEAPAGFDAYQWFKINDGQLEELSNTETIMISTDGEYRLEVGRLYENNGQIITCSTSTDFTVTPSNKASFQEIIIQSVFENNTIEILVTGDGDYEYSLDGETYQDSNQYFNVDAGFYTIFARDKNGCGVSEKEAAIIGFPKFFTPNGDGINDFWQLIGATEEMTIAHISIFDRYGKLLKQLKTNNSGWDGTYNGQLLPAADYWFQVVIGTRDFNGHFSLKR